MMSTIADGHAWHADLSIGTMHGYSGPEIVTPADVIALVEEFQQRPDPRFAVVVWTRGTILGAAFPKETIIKATVQSNPLFTPSAAAATAVPDYAVALAHFLAERLHQVRVYIDVYLVRTIVVEVAP
jgi:hypothetical protein